MKTDFVELIEQATADPNASPDELRSLLRRAALAIRNVDGRAIEPAWSDALLDAMVDLQTINHEEAIRHIVADWLKSNGYLGRDEMDEESQVEGSA